MAGHGHRADGAAPESYDRLRPRLVETLVETGAEVGLHGSYLAAEDLDRLARERALLAQLDGPLVGHRYHYLRVDPHRNLAPLVDIGFRYDTSLGFPDALGFRAGIAHPFRPWDVERDRPADLVEVPLAVMDATLAEERYEALSADGARGRILPLLDWAAENGGGFSILWHPERFDGPSARGWDRLYFDVIDAVRNAAVCACRPVARGHGPGRPGHPDGPGRRPALRPVSELMRRPGSPSSSGHAAVPHGAAQFEQALPYADVSDWSPSG